MKSVKNTVTLIGRLGKDPEVKNFDGGKMLASFSIATSDTYRNDKGEKVEDVQWHNVVAWGKAGEIASKFLKKGTEVVIEGRLMHRNYETAAGDKRYITEVSVNEIVLLGSKQA